MRYLLVAAALGLLPLSCTHPLEAVPVSQRFQELHRCPAPKVYADGDRWIAEGCGVRARYVCLSKYAPDSQALLGGETCIEETSEEIGGEVAGGSEDERDPEAPSERDGVLTSAARMPHGWLVLQGSPGSEARSISVRYRGRSDGARACALVMAIDGEASDVSSMPRTLQARDGSVEHRFELDPRSLSRLAQSRRIAGTICGQSFVLDKLAHARLRAFATRFLELRALRPGAETAKAAATNGDG